MVVSKPIPFARGRYRITSDGRVLSEARKTRRGVRGGGELKQYVDTWFGRTEPNVRFRSEPHAPLARHYVSDLMREVGFTVT